MSNSTLFKQAHRMTRLTIQKGYTYRSTFGKWLSFLTTGITNYIRPNSVNKDCAMIPVLQHDKADKIVFTTPFKVSKVTTNQHGKYIQEGIKPERNQRLLALNIDTMIISFMLALLDSKLFISIIIIMQFMLILKFI